MSITLKSLTLTTDGKFRDASTIQSPGQLFNLITKANILMVVYAVPASTTTLVTSIRFMNTLSSGPVNFSLYFNRPDSSGNSRRRALLPINISIPANFVLYDDVELSMEAGDLLEAQASVAGAVHLIISGCERGLT